MELWELARERLLDLEYKEIEPYFFQRPLEDPYEGGFHTITITPLGGFWEVRDSQQSLILKVKLIFSEVLWDDGKVYVELKAHPMATHLFNGF